MTDAITAILLPVVGQPGLWLDTVGTDPESARNRVSFFPSNAVLFRQTADSRKTNLYEYQVPLLPNVNPAQLASFQREFSLTEPEPELVLYSFNVPNAPSARFMTSVAENGIVANVFGLSIPSITPATAVSNFYRVSIQDRPIVLGDENASSITSPTREPIAEARFASIFRQATEERFEDGMESSFSRSLESIVRRYGSRSFEILARLLVDRRMPESVWAEAMRWLGRADDSLPLEKRLWLLEKGLTSPFPSIRDGALLGLSSIADPSAIPYIERAVNAETIAELRADMQQVLAELRQKH